MNTVLRVVEVSSSNNLKLNLLDNGYGHRFKQRGCFCVLLTRNCKFIS